MTTATPFYLGIDGGGTWCRARVVDASGRVLGTGEAGPASLRLGGDTAWAALMQAAGAALQGAGITALARTIHAGIGVAGVGMPGALEALSGKPHPFASLAIVNDAATACLGAHAGRDGGIVIAGTGSIGFGLTGGREVRVGGWGFPVSDEGSGAWLGLEGVRMALRAHDGRRATTPLLDQIMARFGGNPFAVVAWMATASATDYATLAPLLVATAAQGDPAGAELLRRAAVEIGGLMDGLLQRGVPRLALMGGLGPSLLPWFDDAVRRRLHAPDGDAIDGALRLAGLRASS